MAAFSFDRQCANQQFVSGFPPPPFFYTEYGERPFESIPAPVRAYVQRQQEKQQKHDSVDYPTLAEEHTSPAVKKGSGHEQQLQQQYNAASMAARGSVTIAGFPSTKIDDVSSAASLASPFAAQTCAADCSSPAGAVVAVNEENDNICSTWLYGGRPPPPTPTAGWWSAFGVSYAEKYEDVSLDTDTKLYVEVADIQKTQSHTSSRNNSSSSGDRKDFSAAHGHAEKYSDAAAAEAGPSAATGIVESSTSVVEKQQQGRKICMGTDLREIFKTLYQEYVSESLQLIDSLAQGSGDGSNVANRLRKIVRLHKNLLHILVRLQQFQAENEVLLRLEKQLQKRREAADELKRSLATALRLLESATTTETAKSINEGPK